MPVTSAIAEVLAEHQDQLLQEWLKIQREGFRRRAELIGDAEVTQQCREFLTALQRAVASGGSTDIHGPAWQEVLGVLSDVSRTRGRHGFSPTETAMFVFSLKQPLFTAMRRHTHHSSDQADALWQATELLDKLGLYTTEVHQTAREDVIRRQQEEMLELSTPVIKLWDGILALPLIGTLDSTRTATVMESLLETIVATESEIAILDITGVPTVDTLTAQHLLKTVAAARLMGAECIISGIRPQIAQTVVQLGVDLSGVITKASLADAFLIALRRRRLRVCPLDDVK